MKRVSEIVHGKCPRCHLGVIFRPGWAGFLGLMNQTCPVCGLTVLRETGYFLGAMYVSYTLGVATILPVSIALVLLTHVPLWAILAIMLVQTLVSVPIFLRFSRVIWLHLDQTIDPR